MNEQNSDQPDVPEKTNSTFVLDQSGIDIDYSKVELSDMEPERESASDPQVF